MGLIGSNFAAKIAGQIELDISEKHLSRIGMALLQ